MFVGHIGVGLASKAAAPKTSLGWLVAAPLALDLLWPIFLLLGWEQVRIEPGATRVTPLDFVSYPLSHSLVWACGWGVLLAAVFRWVGGGKKAAWVIAALVVSHWPLDWLMHRPDLPIVPGGATFGLGAWNSLPLTLALEALFFGGGIWLYVRTTRAETAVGRWAWLGFVAFLGAVYGANVLGPPPETPGQVAGVTLALWLLPAWAWWFDRGRGLRAAR